LDSVWFPEYEYPSDQLVIGSPRFVIVIDTTNPVAHWDWIEYATEHPVAALAGPAPATASPPSPAVLRTSATAETT
jgi:hypothetical protein